MLGLRRHARTMSGHPVPPGLHAGSCQACVPRQRPYRRAARRGAHLGQYPQLLRRDSGERTCPRQQLSGSCPIPQALWIGGGESDAQPGAGLVGDGVNGQDRLTGAPVVSLGEVLERRFDDLGEEAPLLGQQVGDRVAPVFDPVAPPACGIDHRGGPSR